MRGSPPRIAFAAAVAAGLALAGGVLAVRGAASAARPYYDAAMQAGRWLLDTAVADGPDRLSWQADPRDPATASTSLYSGTAGVVLFLVEAHRASGDPAFLGAARKGGNSLLAALGAVEGAGLYEGAAGIGFALRELFKATGDARYERGFEAALERIALSASAKGAGVEWDGTTDVISGASGTGLALIYARRELGSGPWLDLAAKAGRRLIEVGRPEAGGLKWAMHPDYPRLMPNFSHGTAGVAYFLASLHAETGERAFLDAALAGAKYLAAVAKTEGGACLVFHDEPDNRDLYYLGWCHGPVGTARLFRKLAEITGDPGWDGWVERSAEALRASGIPERTVPGFWNNAGICCGLAGAGEFFLDLARSAPGRGGDLALAERFARRLLATGAAVDGRMSWLQAEHRVRPDFLVAQTGYMQGAAGIGKFLLEMDAALRGEKAGLRLPDSPWK